MSLTCPVPQYPISSATSWTDWISFARAYAPDSYCGSLLASYVEQPVSDDTRYGPFPTLSDFHAYWWTLASLRTFAFFLLALYLLVQRMHWFKGQRFCGVGFITLLTGMTIIVQVPTWNANVGVMMISYYNAEFVIDWTFGWMVFSWGLVQVIQTYYTLKGKLMFMACLLFLWVWQRQAFLFTWNNFTDEMSAAVWMTLMTFFASLTALCMLAIEEVGYTAGVAFFAGLLNLTLQHHGDHAPYVQATDNQNPWKFTLFVGLFLTVVVASVTLALTIRALVYMGQDTWSSRTARQTSSSMPLVAVNKPWQEEEERGAYDPPSTYRYPALPPAPQQPSRFAGSQKKVPNRN